MKPDRVLITGASGFLGVATREALAARGVEPIASDRRAGDGVVALDTSDPAQVEDVVADHAAGGRLAGIVHLAAAGFADQGLVAGADADPARAVHVNVEGFVHVIRAAARHRVPRVVWSSSTTVYGPADDYPDRPITEGEPLRPLTVYGTTKAACEYLGPILARQEGIEVTSLRLPMVYGPERWYGGSQQTLIDLVRDLHAGASGRHSVWDGHADWIHVDDAAAALTGLVLAPIEDKPPSYHVVGHRGGLADLARALVDRVAGTTHVELETTPGGAPDLPAIDDTALRRDTGFRPRYPSAEHGAATYALDRTHDLPSDPRSQP